jgi:hypothetical protein
LCRWFIYGGGVARQELKNPYFLEMCRAFADPKEGETVPKLTDHALDKL